MADDETSQCKGGSDHYEKGTTIRDGPRTNRPSPLLRGARRQGNGPPLYPCPAWPELPRPASPRTGAGGLPQPRPLRASEPRSSARIPQWLRRSRPRYRRGEGRGKSAAGQGQLYFLPLQAYGVPFGQLRGPGEAGGRDV